MAEWTLMTSYGAILVYVGKHPRVPSVEIAKAIGIRERNVIKNINELTKEGYLRKELVGGVNQYSVNSEVRLSRPMMMEHTVGEFVNALSPLTE